MNEVSKTNNIAIRPATKNDIQNITKLNHDELHYSFSEEHTAEMFERIQARDWMKIYVAEVDGQFTGYVQLAEYLSLINVPMVNIMELAVVGHYQGRGIGRKLVEQAEDWSHELGFAGVRLNSGAERTEAHKFYEKIGFSKIKFQAKFEKKF